MFKFNECDRIPIFFFLSFLHIFDVFFSIICDKMSSELSFILFNKWDFHIWKAVL